MLTIVFPTRYEAADFLKKKKQAHVAISGLGKAGIERVWPSVVQKRPSLVIGAGFAGALRQDLKPGDLILDKSHCLEFWDGLCAKALQRSGLFCREGLFHTASQVVATPEQKKSLAKTTPAMAVEMENKHLASLAKSAGIPYLGVRCVFDLLEEDLSWMLDEGEPLGAKALLAKAMLQPGLWKKMVRATVVSRRCSRLLAQFLEPLADDQVF